MNMLPSIYHVQGWQRNSTEIVMFVLARQRAPIRLISSATKIGYDRCQMQSLYWDLVFCRLASGTTRNLSFCRYKSVETVSVPVG